MLCHATQYRIQSPLTHLQSWIFINDQAEMSIAEIRALHGETHVNRHLQDLQQQAEQDEEYQQLCTIILQGFPAHHHQLTEPCRRYWNIREHLSLDDDLIVYGCRLLIPAKMCQQVLAQLHESHQGTVRTK